jgi:hypothetical protein
MKRLAQGALAAVLVIGLGGGALAQDSKSAPLAKQLAAALDAAKLSSIAAKDPGVPGVYIGALYFPGFQLLAISAKYSAPVLLDTRLEKKEYRDVYIDLNSAAEPNSKMFIEDLGVDGLQAKREENRAFDSVELMGKRTALDGDWKKQQLSEQEYMKIFSAADERYSQMLAALLAQLKKGS